MSISLSAIIAITVSPITDRLPGWIASITQAWNNSRKCLFCSEYMNWQESLTCQYSIIKIQFQCKCPNQKTHHRTVSAILKSFFLWKRTACGIPRRPVSSVHLKLNAYGTGWKVMQDWKSEKKNLIDRMIPEWSDLWSDGPKRKPLSARRKTRRLRAPNGVCSDAIQTNPIDSFGLSP